MIVPLKQSVAGKRLFGKPKNKYRNTKTVIDDHKFDSKKEANRYLCLKLMQDRGAISHLELQPSFKISEGGHVDPVTGRKMAARKYVADFMYIDTSVEPHKSVVEDVKSAATKKDKLYRMKRQLFLEQYGDKFTFKEI